ncbi:MAG: hypothetical protein M1814_003164 [Vezdaea aestivalis]|nr:MAG: hypothetical protein M1814_003164 [Vezdaea aestivalis]
MDPELPTLVLPKWGQVIMNQIILKNYNKADQLCRKRVNKGNNDELTMALQIYSLCYRVEVLDKRAAFEQAKGLLTMAPIQETSSLLLIESAMNQLGPSTIEPLQHIEKEQICLDTKHDKEAIDFITSMSASFKPYAGHLDSLMINTKFNILAKVQDYAACFQFMKYVLEHSFPPATHDSVGESITTPLVTDESTRKSALSERATYATSPQAAEQYVSQGDTWASWKKLCDSAVRIGVDSVQEVFQLIDWVDELTISSKHLDLAKIYMCGLCQLHFRHLNKEEPINFSGMLKGYLQQAITQQNCFFELKPFFQMLFNDEVDDILSFVQNCASSSAKESTIQIISYINATTNYYRIRYLLLVGRVEYNQILATSQSEDNERPTVADTMPVVKKHPCWFIQSSFMTKELITEINDLVIAYQTCLKIQEEKLSEGPGSPLRRVIAGDLLFLTATATLKAASRGNTFPILRAAVLLKTLREKAPEQQSFSMCQIRLYLLLGAVGPATNVWKEGPVKNMLVDSFCHHFFSRLSTMAPFKFGQGDLSVDSLAMVSETLASYSQINNKGYAQQRLALERGDIKGAYDNMKFRRDLDDSHTLWALKIEKRRIERLSGRVDRTSGFRWDYPQKFVDRRAQAVANFEPHQLPTTGDHYDMWPMPDNFWVFMLSLAEDFINHLDTAAPLECSRYRDDYISFDELLKEHLPKAFQSAEDEVTDAELTFLAMVKRLVEIERSASIRGWSPPATHDLIRLFSQHLALCRKSILENLETVSPKVKKGARETLLSWEYFHAVYMYLDSLKIAAKLPKRANFGRVGSNGASPEIPIIKSTIEGLLKVLRADIEKWLAILEDKGYVARITKLVLGEGDAQFKEQGDTLRLAGLSENWCKKTVGEIVESQRHSLRSALSVTISFD